MPWTEAHATEDRRAGPEHHWVSDLDGAIEQARDRLDRAVDALAAQGVDAVGSVGDSDPLVAIDDALRSFAAHEIIIATHPPGQSNWLERNLVDRVRERHGLPVTHLTSSYDLQPALADHWDGLKASRPIGDQTRGVGARRQVDLRPIGALLETVTAWEEGRTLATTNQPSGLVPFKQAEARLTLEPHGDGTAITFDYRYVPRGGPMGRLTGPVIDKDAEDQL
jgi:Polyketide cyclase / dehydrase and lipid transport